MNLANLEVHQLAKVIPRISGEEIDELAASIKEVGLKQPLMLFEGQILDGRHRYEACQRAGYKLGPDDVVLFEEKCEGQDPVEYVIALNLTRRHLTRGQREASLADFVEFLPKAKPGPQRRSKAEQVEQDNSEHSELIPKTEKVAALAKQQGLSLAGVQTASHIKKVAPELHEEVKEGRMTMNQAKKEVRRKTKPKPSGDEHDLAKERLEQVCDKRFITLWATDQVPGLKTVGDLVAFAGLSDKEMGALCGPLYRAQLSFAEAKRFYDKHRTNDGEEWEVDWDWRIRDLNVLVKAKDRCRVLVDMEIFGEWRVTLERVKREEPGPENQEDKQNEEGTNNE